MSEAPLGQFEIVVLNRDPQVPARAGSILTLVEHVPLWIIPIGLATGLHRELVH